MEDEDRAPQEVGRGRRKEAIRSTEPTSRSPSERLHLMVTGYRDAQALYVVAKLGIPDLLAEGPKPVEVLARKTGVQPRPLFRVMRMLAGRGVFTQDASDRFGLAPLGDPLRSDHPETMRQSMIMHGELHYQAAGALLHTVRTGETAFDHLYGKGLFAYLAEHPEDSAVFNAAMTNSARAWRNPLHEYDFRSRKLIVDVGGGRGHVLADLLGRNPHLRGILYDLPQGVTEAPAVLRALGIADRAEIRTGNAFESIPSGGDVYLFSRVLHDWPDDKARALLANTRKAMGDGAVLLLWEAVVPEGAEPSLTKEIDLTMLFLLGGAERTEPEWRRILAETGFELLKVTKSGGMFDLVEAKPV